MAMPLTGVRILDLTRVLAGPYCTMVLADLGAEVLKIEPSGTGDDSRAFGPFICGESTYFMSLNRNKKSLTLNLKTAGGKSILKELAKQVDILIENYRPGTMKKLGLDYSTLSVENPKLIYAAISGFGQEGPSKDKPAYDFIVQGMGGIMGLNAHPAGPPTRVPIGLGDITAGLYTAVGILSALRERDLSGKGQMIDISMLDCQVAILENPIVRFFAGETPKPLGNTHPTISPTGGFPTQDSYIILAIGNDQHWKVFCQVVGRPQWISDPHFSSNSRRTENMPALRVLLEQLFSEHETAYWIGIIEKAGVPCGPVNSIEEVVRDPQIRFRNMITSVNHPVAGEVKMSGIPIKMSRTPGEVTLPPPTLGQHSTEILKSYLKLTDETIEELQRSGVL
jgi:CoA:oxalate CoA-transferase